MKFSKLIKYIILPAIGMCICLNWYFAYAYSSGPPVGYTNAPKDCGNCTSCHSTVSLKSKSARIKLSGITGGYAANDTFHMVLTYLNSVSAKGHLYGFEVVVLDSATKKNMGTIKVTDKTNTGSSSSSGCSGASRTYIYQTSSGTKAAISKNWKFDWIAPSTTTGTAIFYTIINSANGDASDGGDTIFAQEFHYKAVSKLVAGFKCASSVCTGDSLAITDTSKGTPTSWSWTFQNGSPSTSTLKNPKVAFSASGSDTITLVAKNASSTSTKIFVVTVNSAPVASITPSTTSSVCWGDSVLFTSSSGSSYLWSNGAKTQSIYVKDSQSYTVIVTNSSGCSTKSSPLSVSYITPPVAKITAAASSICPGDSVLLSASSGASYLWSNGDTTQTIYVKDSLPYTVTVSNSSGCSVKSSPLKIKLNVPVAKITPASTLGICSGDSILLTASSASSYLWSTGAVSQSIYVKDSLPYTVKVTNSSGCSASSSPFKVKINTPSATIKASTSSPICDGDSVLLTASSGSSYVWSNGATTQSIYVKDSLAYSVKINGTPGCGATSNSIKIQINALPSANITPGTTSAICQGDSVQLSASSGSTYLWSNGAKTQSIYVKDSLAYKVKVTNSSGCSATSSPAKIKINALPKVSITPAKSSVCVGDSVLLTATSGSSYSWSNGSTSQTIYVKDSLSYTVNVSNSSGCSATSVPVKIKINSLPLASITPASSSICSGDSVLLSASPGSSFLWSNGATSK